ncbi:MAG: alpha/beta hydrolase [bacterium]|nr:alpha/beta hydrolase [bacterium]
MEKKLNCIIIHGCPSNETEFMTPDKHTYYKHWIQWVKNQLILKEVATEAPLMPSPWAPDYEAFKKEFEKYSVSENTILIGHSCGCAFLVRYLGESKKKIRKLILVGPWKIPKEGNVLKEKFYTYDIDETIKSRVQEIIMFTADNEREDGKKSLEIYKKSLGGKIIELKGRGHYIFKDMGTEEFPELINEIITNN